MGVRACRVRTLRPHTVIPHTDTTWSTEGRVWVLRQWGCPHTQTPPTVRGPMDAEAWGRLLRSPVCIRSGDEARPSPLGDTCPPDTRSYGCIVAHSQCQPPAAVMLHPCLVCGEYACGPAGLPPHLMLPPQGRVAPLNLLRTPGRQPWAGRQHQGQGWAACRQVGIQRSRVGGPARRHLRGPRRVSLDCRM